MTQIVILKWANLHRIFQSKFGSGLKVILDDEVNQPWIFPRSVF